ncbi:Cytochrome P450 2L1-like 1 [Homarus americanus]|uniref:Cytochrome P450 2L1-like 1 n=1 Tax=Homarus americanus TaxID=6706 RepID=A0A8J5K5K4_HOMAM|nr:Cytochrome P450 2L1-like 1 [Homarus americanus]
MSGAITQSFLCPVTKAQDGSLILETNPLIVSVVERCHAAADHGADGRVGSRVARDFQRRLAARRQERRMLAEAALGVLLLVLLFTLANRRPKGLPPGWGVLHYPPLDNWKWGWSVLGRCPQVIAVVSPGEWGWPVLGALMPVGVTMDEHVKTLRHKYGDIFTRRFALRQLKDLGMGKSSLMEAMHYEAMCLVDDFKKHTGQPQPIPKSLNVAVLNIIWKLTADIRYDVDDPKTQKFQDMIIDVLEKSQGPSLIFDMCPWLVTICPPFVNKYLGVTSMLESYAKIKEFMLRVVKEHQASLDPEKPRDYIDFYLLEMEAQQSNPESTMSELDLWVHVADLFTAGSETTNHTLMWALMILAKYPDVQARVQREIDDVVARGTLPTLQDKPKLPYLEAVIHEVNRFVSLAPLGFTHSARTDTQLAGFTIPKGTMIIPNQEMCHKDPTYWEKPEEFYPEHFLDSEGKLSLRKENYLPFSIGRRVCPGESLARMQLYFFLSALLQNFTFSEPEGEPLDLQKDPSTLFLNYPKPLNVVITTRA